MKTIYMSFTMSCSTDYKGLSARCKHPHTHTRTHTHAQRGVVSDFFVAGVELSGPDTGIEYKQNGHTNRRGKKNNNKETIQVL